MDQRASSSGRGEGDHDAFAVLATAAVARLDAAARLILRDPELARDAVQDALVRAWRDLPGLRDPDRFDAWLHRLLVNACLDACRRRRRRPIEVELTPIDARRSPRRRRPLADRELSTGARAASTRSTARSSSCTTTWACRCPRSRPPLGIPLGTAKSRLHRALGRCAPRRSADAELDAEPIAGGQPA